jgi:two-component sensor histidine kinase
MASSSDCQEMRPIRDHEGWLCFGMGRGFVRVNPSLPFAPTHHDRVFLEQLLVDGERRSGLIGVPWPAAMDLGTGGRRVEITFTTPQLSSPENVRFRYRLSGLDEEWHDAGRQRTAVFPGLPAGHYRFEAMATEADGSWTAPVALALVLHPHFWETGWFYGGCVLAACLGGGAVVGAVFKARMERQRAVDAERERIAKDLHDDLGASLTQIAIFSELAQADLAQPEQAAVHMERVFQTARSSARALDEIVWASNPAHDSLESFVAYVSKVAQDFVAAAGLKFRMEAPKPLPSAVLPAVTRHHLLLVTKEALHNVAKHARASKVRLRIAVDAGIFGLSIEDDGCGFSGPSSDVGADGLRNMERRVKHLGGVFECKSAPGEGTTITMRVPI